MRSHFSFLRRQARQEKAILRRLELELSSRGEPSSPTLAVPLVDMVAIDELIVVMVSLCVISLR